MIVLAVALGGALGAIVRHLVVAWTKTRVQSWFPWGTFVVNITGTWLLGFALALAADERIGASTEAFTAIGLCGAVTTFSTFAFEIDELRLTVGVRLSIAYAMATVSVGLVAAALGMGSEALIT